MTEPNHKQLIHSETKHRVAQRHKTVLWLFGIIFFVCEMEQIQAIWCLKCKSLNINLLFIELLYKSISQLFDELFMKKKQH